MRLGWILAIAAVLATPTLGILRDLRADDSSCPLSRAGSQPKHLIFIFEGHGNHSPAAENEMRSMLARGMDCSRSPGQIRFSDGTEISIPEASNRLYALRPENGSVVGLRGILLESLCRYGQLDFSGTEIFYFDEEHEQDRPLACAEAHARAGSASVSVYGYSHGGYEAIQFATELVRRGIRLDLGTTIDPVPKGVKQSLRIGLAYLSVQPYGSGSDLRAPDGVSWYNFWQTIDNRWDEEDHESYGLHGVSVSNTVVNRQLVPQTDPQQPRPNGAHWRILTERELNETLGSAARKLRGLSL